MTYRPRYDRRFMRQMEARPGDVLRLLAFMLALVSYWAPWVAHTAAGLSLAEQDLTEFPKFMPQVRQHELIVVRESFYFPLIVLAVALILWAATPHPSPPPFATPTPTLPRDEGHIAGEGAGANKGGNSPSPACPACPAGCIPARGTYAWAGRNAWVRVICERLALRDVSPEGGLTQGERARVAAPWLMRAFATALALIVLPAYPFFLDGFQSTEFQTQQILSVGTIGLVLLTPLLRRIPDGWKRRVLFIWFLLGALLPTAQYFWMKPALDQIYNRPVMIGWGLWAGLIGFVLLAVSQTAKRATI